MLKNILLAVFLFFKLALNVQAQKLQLRVLDAQTREPLSFVSVKYEKSGGFTDTAGYYTVFIPQKNGSLEVSFQILGYVTQKERFKPSAVEQVVLLQPLNTALGEVVVSGSLREMSRAESPVPIEVYTPKFFKANPAPSLFDGLNLVNGVQPQLNCNVCNTGDIHINGLEGPYTMILIDGMPIVSALSTVYGLQGIPLSLIERMEIVKGPASTLYGSEAVAGLINIITKDPRHAPAFSMDVNRSGYEETSLDAGARLRMKNMAGLLALNAFDFQRRWDTNNDNFTDVTLQRRFSVFGKLAFDRPQNRTASLAARYVWEDRFGGEWQWSRDWYGSDSIYGEAIRTNRAELLATWQAPVRLPLFLNLSFTIHDQRSAYGTTIYDARQQVGFGQVYWTETIANHNLLAGTAVRHTWLDDNTPLTVTTDGQANRPANTWLPGLFVQDDIKLNDKHRLLLGLRYDYHSVHGSVWSPRANWKWTLSNTQTLRLSAGNGYRVANVFSEDHAALTGSRQVVFQEALRPERSWNGNLNYTLQFFPTFGFVNLDFSAFYTYFTNRILADYTADPNVVLYANLDGHAVSRGLALNTDWNFTNSLKIRAGATWMEVFTSEKGKRAAQLHAPPFSATWSVGYTLPGLKVLIDYTGSVTSPMPLPVVPDDFRPSKSPWFSLQNLQLSRTFGHVELYGGVKNILDFRPRHPLLRPFDPFDKQANDPVSNPYGYTFDTAYNYAPLQGRRWFAGLRLTL